MMKYTYDVETYSDLYKDVYGCRPRGNAWDNWVTATPDEKQNMWDYLCEALELELKAEQERKERNIIAFESKIQNLIECGAADRATALRWLREADDVSMDDPDYFCFRHGLPHDYLKR